MSALNIVWYALVGAIFTGYAVLDGFDLGVGALHLFARSDQDRRVILNSIGPVWDGNEVWIVVGGGALFAAFPPVYAAVFSGLYLPLMLLLFALVFRAVAIEFRSKRPERWWRQAWDIAFCVASVAAALLLGAALGNVVRGIPLDAAGDYAGTALDLLNPYALLVAVATVALFAMHGAIYLVLRTEGELRARAEGWVRNTIIFFTLMYVLVTMATLVHVPRMAEHLRTRPWLWAAPVLTLLSIANIPRCIHHGRFGRAFMSSCASIVGLLLLVGMGMFPDLVVATDPARSLTAFNAASTPTTLRTMLIIAAVGLPLVTGYTVGVYWLFRGKVKLDPTSY